MKGFSKQNALLVILIGTLLIGLSVSVSAPVAISNFHVNPSGEPPEDSCSCPASGNWEIINSDNCKLTTPCRVTGNVNVINGSLEVDTGAGGRLFVPKEYKIHGSKANGKLTWGK